MPDTRTESSLCPQENENAVDKQFRHTLMQSAPGTFAEARSSLAMGASGHWPVPSALIYRASATQRVPKIIMYSHNKRSTASCSEASQARNHRTKPLKAMAPGSQPTGGLPESMLRSPSLYVGRRRIESAPRPVRPESWRTDGEKQRERARS